MFPDESKVMEGTGNLFSVADLTYVGNIGTTYSDALFTDTSMLIFRENTVLELAREPPYAQLREVAKTKKEAKRIFKFGDRIIARGFDGSTVYIESVRY